MKTKLVPLIGDPLENLYQLGIKERESFLKLEDRIQKLLSTNIILRQGQDILTRARLLLKKKTPGPFDQAIKAYAEGLGVDPLRYKSFLSLFELAAHYGQVYPELKGLLPGCTSLFEKTETGIIHSRLLDFPLIGLFEAAPRVYYWKMNGRPSILSYSCEGLAPLFLQGIHESGISFALHHKPGLSWNHEGSSIFEILFETLLETEKFQDFKKVLKNHSSITKWCILLLNAEGEVQVMDIDGPALIHENYHLNDTSPLIFTNIPLQRDLGGFDSFIRFSDDRQNWLKEKLPKRGQQHILDLLLDVEDQRIRRWLHPTGTLSTVGASSVNLTTGLLDLKEGPGPLVKSDAIVRISLASQNDVTTLKEASPLTAFELAWKRAGSAQAAFDQGNYDLAYHELQMSEAMMPQGVWKQILSLYLCIWDYKFVSNSKELALIYQRLKKLQVPPQLKDQWLLMKMRFEKKLGLMLTVDPEEINPHLRTLFEQEIEASKPLFLTWMNLLYPRIEVLEVFSPHHK